MVWCSLGNKPLPESTMSKIYGATSQDQLDHHVLIHSGLVTAYGSIEPGQHWLR